jgi:hypothetical protein
MNAKDIIKVGAGFLAGGLYVCWVEANACREGRWYIQHRNKNGDFKDIGTPLFDPNNKEEETSD